MSLRIAPTLIVMLSIATSPVESLLRAEGESQPKQSQFMPRENCRPMIRRRNIPLESLALPFAPTGVNGPWLWVGEAWVQSAEVVPLNQADEYYTGLLRLKPANIWALRMRARTRESENHLDDALRDLSEIVRLNPKDVDARVDRAFFQVMKNDYAEALADIEVALKLDRTDSLLFVVRATLLLLQSQNDDALNRALQDCEEAIRREPELGIAFAVRGVIRSGMKEYDKALLDYAEAIRLEPADHLIYISRAWLWSTADDLKYRDPQGAIASATKGCELAGWKDADAVYILGIAYKSAGDIDSANRWILKATRMGASPELPKGDLLLRSIRGGSFLQGR